MKITLEAVTKRFGDVTAVEAVSLEIRPGECFFLLGPSGCGKTTLLRAIAGFCVPETGQIRFNDQPVNHLPPDQRNTGMVFQNYALWPHLTVAENVAFGLTVPGRNLPAAERRARVQRILEAVHLADFKDRLPNALSGGQQQRVALARALVIEPAALLLDEPLANLDAKLRQEMRGEIRRLVKTAGITTVYVTHDQEEALSMADCCAVLRSGRVEQAGTPRELYEQPANAFVAEFISGANLVAGTVRARDHEIIRIETAAGEWIGRAGSYRPAVGASVIIGLRPESIRPAAPAGAAPNQFAGRVLDRMYYGERIEYRLALSDGTLLKARVPAASGFPGLTAEEGDFQVAPAEVLVLPATPAV